MGIIIGAILEEVILLFALGGVVGIVTSSICIVLNNRKESKMKEFSSCKVKSKIKQN